MFASPLAALLVGGCDRRSPEAVADTVQTDAPATMPSPATRPIAVTTPTLKRADLVGAAAQEASAFAEGRQPDSAALAGRSFAVRIPFGCAGPTPPDAPAGERDGLAGWTWAPDRKSIRLTMTPGDWTRSALLTDGGAGKWEAVEGFWIPRPWLASETCPAIESDPLQTGSAPASPQTVGLAAVFETGGSRIGRRAGRAYAYTARFGDEQPVAPPEKDYRLALEGRVAAFSSGQAIECRAAGPDQRPVCIIAMQLDRVAFEDADGSVLSEWRPG